MAPCLAAVTTRATCVLLLLLLLSADVQPPLVSGQAPPEPDAATIEADSDGRGNGTRGGGTAPRNKVLSTVDCQICEATCRIKCLINNLFQWGTCYQRCKADNCNDWCR
ncbi:unnamed protein product [Alopecurus aequalis]